MTVSPNECHNSVTGLPAPLRILCHLTRGNRQPCQPVGDRRMATARLAGQELTGGGQPGRGIARVGHRDCRAYTGYMSAMREELHHLVDLLPEAELRPALELIRAYAAGEDGPERDLPFFASFEADPDLAERAEGILASELGR